ncbi:MAG: MFS transporter, partial [Armatimonadota bacterium]
FSTERFLAVAHIVGGVLLIALAKITQYPVFYWTMLAYALLYAPTVALTNSLSFHHLRDAEKEFGGIRLWGTIGWIVVGWLFGYALARWKGVVSVGDCLNLAGVIAIVLGVYSFTLPHTPPAKEAKNPWAFLEALKMLEHRNFAVLFFISFFVATELAFYYQLSAIFFRKGVGLSESWVGPVMTIGQVAEVLVLAMLPFALKRLGMKRTIAIGIATWPVRYFIFSLGSPMWLVIAAQALHGICYAFFFVAGQVYTDSVATPDIRGSAQSLIFIATQGIGMLAGNFFAGWAQDHFTVRGEPDFHKIYLIPVAITFACAVAFVIGFKSEQVNRKMKMA